MHTAAIDRLKAYGTSPNEDTDESPIWFVNMPEYRQWIRSGHGTLCYIDSDGVKMSALVSDIVNMELPLHPVFSKTIYLDCSQYDASDPAEAEMGALHSLIYQNIFIHPGSIERLSEYFKTIRQPVGRSFNRLFHENMDEDVQPDCGFMVDALRWVIPVDPQQSFTIIDKIDCMTKEGWQHMLARLLSKFNDEVDHILFVGRNDPDLAAKFEELQTISPRVEAMRKCYLYVLKMSISLSVEQIALCPCISKNGTTAEVLSKHLLETLTTGSGLTPPFFGGERDQEFSGSKESRAVVRVLLRE